MAGILFTFMKSNKVIILAGGKGTRMNSDQPKVLSHVCGRPMIDHVIDAVEKINLSSRPIVVVGYKGNLVRNQVKERADHVWQQNQFGTGHAVACAREALSGFAGSILVLYGDHPLISHKTIDNLFELHQREGSSLTMMTTEVEDFDDWRQGFYNFGRIIRNDDNSIQLIREMKDCSEDEKKVRELNPGYYCFDSAWLWENIDKIQNTNNQQEYYLTDLVEMAVQQNKIINSIKIHPIECLGVNTADQLELVEKLIKEK